MNKPVFYIVFFFLFSKSLIAQVNLVPNGSFEELSDCPTGVDIEKAIGWFSPSQGTPDLFNECIDLALNYSVPQNTYGYQNAQEGLGYAGFVPYSYADVGNYREYLEIQLLEPLKINEYYKVSFYISLSDNSPIACNNVSYGFFSDSIFYNHSDIIVPVLKKENPSIFLNSSSWQLYESYYLAQGDEEYFIIGNFYDDLNTDTISILSSTSEPYYFIDNISVEAVNFGDVNVITPNGDGVNEIVFFNPFIKDYQVDIINRWGQLINSIDFSTGWDGTSLSGKELNDGIYYFRVFEKENTLNILKTGFIHLIH